MLSYQQKRDQTLKLKKTVGLNIGIKIIPIKKLHEQQKLIRQPSCGCSFSSSFYNPTDRDMKPVLQHKLHHEPHLHSALRHQYLLLKWQMVSIHFDHNSVYISLPLPLFPIEVLVHYLNKQVHKEAETMSQNGNES